MELSSLSQPPSRRHWLRRILVPLCAVIAAALVLLLPLLPLDKANLIGYSICHQIPSRSFHIAGHRLPLCARCTGTYLGVAIGFATVAILRRWRASEMLSPAMIVVMVLFIVVMGVDGVNSYFSLFDGLPHLYAPRNWLRALTGSLNGLALSMIVLPVFNYTLWKDPPRVRPLRSAWELIGVVIVAAAAVGIVQSEPPWLLYPLALLSVGGVLWMLTLVNTMVLLILLRQDSAAETWGDTVMPLLGGLAATLLELTTMGVIRYALTGTMSWPLAM